MTEPTFEITKAATFDAAHRLPQGGPEGSPYTRVHGHSFKVEATVRGTEQAPVGWVADLGALDAALKAAASELDHSLLNDHPGLESPTLEHLCLFFAGKLQPDFVTDRIRNFALQLKNARHFPVILGRPDMALVMYLDKLRCNAHSSALTASATFEDIVHTQFAADLVYRLARVLVTHR